MSNAQFHPPGHVECRCGHVFEVPQAPCPDNKPGCLMVHYAKDAFRCPKCGEDTRQQEGEPALKITVPILFGSDAVYGNPVSVIAHDDSDETGE